MSAANALMLAIHARLSTDAGLLAMLGPDGIRDRLLPRPALPCIVYGRLDTSDLSTDTEPGEEHKLTIEVWSDGEGRRQAQEIGDRVEAILENGNLTLDGATLVSLFRTGTLSRREPKTRYFLSELRFRAVTE